MSVDARGWLAPRGRECGHRVCARSHPTKSIVSSGGEDDGCYAEFEGPDGKPERLGLAALERLVKDFGFSGSIRLKHPSEA